MRSGAYDEHQLERHLHDRGLMNRFVFGRLARAVTKSWHMYPLGVLFGLGFDTATEVGLLAVSAGVAAHAVPAGAVLSLPILFAAGMSLLDTADGAFIRTPTDGRSRTPCARSTTTSPSPACPWWSPC